MGKILVTGGCGYIGSHTIVDLLQKGFDVISIDNLSNSSEDVLIGIEKITGKRVKNYRAGIHIWEECKTVIESEPDITAIIHFAALKSVEDSVYNPVTYFDNNILGIQNVIRMVEEHDIPNLIFSSSCTVYGNSKDLPVVESTPFGEAQSPYGATKQVAEIMLKSYYLSRQEKNCISLRYFNPAGAHESEMIGESPSNKASNLVPVITETAIGKRETMTVFGDDYDTIDGSCVRDYIHVMDLAEAHTNALQYLTNGENTSSFETFNLGLGKGVSVLEAIQAFEKVADLKLNFQIGPRRAGDVVSIYADTTKSESKLKWKASRGIEEIMLTAWKWEMVRVQ